MKKHLLTILGYFVATFGSQAMSHFLLFKQHYAQVTHIKPEPIFALGFTSILLQGLILSVVYERSSFSSGKIFSSLKFSWLFGLFLVSYIGLAEAAKYAVPDVLSWIGVEILIGFIQFTIAGLFLNLAHRNSNALRNS